MKERQRVSELGLKGKVRKVLRCVLAVLFVIAGVNHFRSPAIYLAMIPPMVPWPGALNIISGLAEILGGIGLLIPFTRRFSAWGLIALLIAVFPANVYVALRGHMDGTTFSPATLWLRLPFQFVFIGAIWWIALKQKRFESAWDTPLN